MLEELKHTYQKIEPPKTLVENGWNDIAFRLPPQESISQKIFTYKTFMYSSMAILLIITLGIIQIAKPGNLFFSIKIFTGKTLNTFTPLIEETHFNILPNFSLKPLHVYFKSISPSITPTEQKTEIHNQSHLEYEYTPKPTVTSIASPSAQKQTQHSDNADDKNQEVRGIKTENENHTTNGNINNGKDGKKTND